MRFGVVTQTTKLEIQYRKHMKNNIFKHYVQLLKIKRIQKTCKNNQEYAREHLNWMTRNYYPVKKSGQSSINWLDKLGQTINSSEVTHIRLREFQNIPRFKGTQISKLRPHNEVNQLIRTYTNFKSMIDALLKKLS